jgi:cbb3-type cytochrome oxidase subunit 3
MPLLAPWRSIGAGTSRNLSISHCAFSFSAFDCLDVEDRYYVRVLAYRGLLTYPGDILEVAPVNTTLRLQVNASTTATTVTLEWTALAHATSPSGYALWLKYASAYNGYLAEADDLESLNLAVELVPVNSSTRIALPGSASTYTFAGCFRDSATSAQHCISPWTVYRAFVLPLFDGVSGAPSLATAVTLVGDTADIVVLEVEEVSASSITLAWTMSSPLAGPIESFSLQILGSSGDRNISYTNTRSASDQAANSRYSFTVADLQPYTQYQFVLEARGTASTGTDTAANLTTSTAESVPSKMNAVVVSFDDSGDTALVSWTQPSPLPGVIIKYEVVVGYQEGVSSGVIVYSGTALSASLPTATGSDFRVRATTSAGSGPWSDAPAQKSSSSFNLLDVSDPRVYGSVAGIGALCLLLVLLSVHWYRNKRRFEEEAAAFAPPEPDEWGSILRVSRLVTSLAKAHLELSNGDTCSNSFVPTCQTRWMWLLSSVRQNQQTKTRSSFWQKWS